MSPGYTHVAAAIGKGQLRSCLIVIFVAWFTLYLQLRSVARRYLLTSRTLHAYIGGIARENGIPALAIGGTADHIHLLLSLPRTISVAKAVQVLKSVSSKWLHETQQGMRNFAWQEGYGAFSIGISQREKTVRYIETQAEHHKRASFADEMNKFLAAHGLAGTPPQS